VAAMADLDPGLVVGAAGERHRALARRHRGELDRIRIAVAVEIAEVVEAARAEGGVQRPAARADDDVAAVGAVAIVAAVADLDVGAVLALLPAGGELDVAAGPQDDVAAVAALGAAAAVAELDVAVEGGAAA